MSRGGLKFLGFILPFQVGDIAGDVPRDSRPVGGMCVLCKRQSPVTYLRGDGNRVCDTDIDETWGMRDVRRARGRRSLSSVIPEVVPATPFAESDYRASWWDRQLA